MKRKKSFIYLLGWLIITGCTSDEQLVNSEKPFIDPIIEDVNASKESFTEGDEIGIYLVKYVNGSPGLLGDPSEPRLMNVKYRFNGVNWYADDGREIYIGDATADLYAFYPYDDEMSRIPEKVNLSAYPFQIETDQRASSQKSDFLWSKNSDVTSVDIGRIEMYHLLNRCVINLQFDDGSEITDPNLTIHNVQTASIINLRSGLANPNGNIQQIKPHLNSETSTGYDITYDVILIPQTISAGTPLFTVNFQGQRLLYETQEDIILTGRGYYTFNLTVRYVAETRGYSIAYLTLDNNE